MQKKPSSEDLVSGVKQKAESAAEFKPACKTMQREEAYLDRILESVHVGILVIDPEKRKIVDLNSHAAEMIGRPKDQILGRVCHQFICPREKGKCPVIDLHQTVDHSERFLITNNGNEVPIIKHVVSIKQDTRELLVESFIDITNQKLTETSLRESEEKYRSMVESMRELVYICSADLQIEYMNPALIRRTGRDGTGEKCFKVLHDQDAQCAWCVWHEVAWGKTAETEIISPKDNRIYRVLHTPIQHEDGTVSKMTIFRDMTTYKQALHEKEVATEQMRAAQKMEAIGTLAGGIAHDFNNILTAIIGYAELVKLDVIENPRALENLKEVLQAGNRAKELVDQILAFSRQTESERIPVKPLVIIKEALKLLRASLPSTIEVRQDISADETVLADPTQIHQIIMNLCTNALHAMDAKRGVLQVSLSGADLPEAGMASPADLMPGPYLKLSVKDTGHGIPPEIMSKIFNPYFTTKDTDKGTGLGLAIVHGIVKDHGGALTVKSEPAKGSTFDLYLPVITTGEETVAAEDNESIPTGNERILFVDDEPGVVNLGQKMLERLGYRVRIRTSSIEALELFKKQPEMFDMVITDTTMPQMTGDVLAQELLKIRPDIPIILCSGFSARITDKKTSEMGIRAFVMKPFVMRDFAKTIRAVLDDK